MQQTPIVFDSRRVELVFNLLVVLGDLLSLIDHGRYIKCDTSLVQEAHFSLSAICIILRVTIIISCVFSLAQDGFILLGRRHLLNPLLPRKHAHELVQGNLLQLKWQSRLLQQTCKR